MYCVKCKGKTDTTNAKTVRINNKLRMVGNCSVCGSGQSQFVGKQKGGAEIHVKLNNEAYKNKKDKKDEVDGYKLDKKISNKKTSVYSNGETAIVAHRGTKLSDKNDLKNDVKLLTGQLESSKRVKNAAKVTREAEKKYGKVEHTGHSLGFAVAKAVVDDKNTSLDNSKIVAYNGAVPPHQALSNLTSKKTKKEKNIEFHTTGVDPISVGGLTYGQTVMHKPTSVNTHSLSNFQEGKGKTKVTKAKATTKTTKPAKPTKPKVTKPKTTTTKTKTKTTKK